MRCFTMREYDLQKLINNPEIVDKKIKELMEKKLLFKQEVDKEEMMGYLLKAEHNLRFVLKIIKENFFDWALTGCYYSCYHAALALIQSKGYTSKNHLATLCVIIKEFYKKELTKEDVEILSNFLDYEDVLFYVETKHKREDATYSTKTHFDKNEVERLRMQATMFVNKIKDVLKEVIYR
ncbi:HEPN domain-containing protein [Candidatus Woesearchaeota archaeon]|nr:MAG: HEPN domain-containing protein [Candidatus Woesearchaeota archaeon]